MPRTPKFNTQQKLKNLNENDDVMTMIAKFKFQNLGVGQDIRVFCQNI